MYYKNTSLIIDKRIIKEEDADAVDEMIREHVAVTDVSYHKINALWCEFDPEHKKIEESIRLFR